MRPRFLRIWDCLRSYTITHTRKTRRSARLAFEVLEDRSVPTANGSGLVSGLAFIDANQDGIHQATEAILPGVPVTLTQTAGPTHDAVPRATTDLNGAFTFLNVLPGTYKISAGPVSALLDGSASVGALNAPAGVTISLPTPLSANQNIGFHGGLAPRGISMLLFLTNTTEAEYPYDPAGTGEALANYRVNNLPITVSGASANLNISVPQATAKSEIDLAGYFTDPDITNSQVTFHITNGATPQTIALDLFDKAAPQTVANFLDYVKSGAYNNSIFSRLASGFVLQGGGTALNGTGNGLNAIAAHPAVPSEFSGAPNVIHTIAMAQAGGNPNSATNEFFFNLADNSTTNLDPKKFTVFGAITDVSSQFALNSLAQTPTHDESALVIPGVDLKNVPLPGYTPALPNQFPTDAAGHFMVINSITVDKQDEFLSYKILSNSNLGLVTTPATLATEHLTLNYVAGQTGTAQIVVEATDRYGASVTQTINVTVVAAA